MTDPGWLFHLHWEFKKNTAQLRQARVRSRPLGFRGSMGLSLLVAYVRFHVDGRVSFALQTQRGGTLAEPLLTREEIIKDIEHRFRATHAALMLGGANDVRDDNRHLLWFNARALRTCPNCPLIAVKRLKAKGRE